MRNKRTLMTIFPHPDDESFFAAQAILKAKREGWKVVVVTLTKGEAGKNYLGKGNLAEIRTRELQKATKILGVDELILGSFSDGKLKDTQESWFGWIEQKIDFYKPDKIITYDPSGITGHPDHIVLSVALLKFKTRLVWVTTPKYIRVYNSEIADILTPPTYSIGISLDWFKKWRAVKAHASQKLFMPLPWEWYHEVDMTKDYPYRFVEFEI